jgi:hypothetical protein
MKTQKPLEQTELKEELDIKQIKKKYGGEEHLEMDYNILVESQSAGKEGSYFTEEDFHRRLNELHEELKQTKMDLNDARQNGRDTGPIYKEKQNLEQKIHKLRQKIDEIENKPEEQKDSEKKLEKAKLLTRQGIVNIRP